MSNPEAPPSSPPGAGADAASPASTASISAAPPSAPPTSATSTQPISGGLVQRARREPERRRISVVVYHRDGAEAAVLHPGLPLTVGRSRPAQVRIADATLSREHARFTLVEGRVLVEDLRSTNGTWIAGQRVGRAELEPGGEVWLGDVLACVHALGPSEEEPGMEGEEAFRRLLEAEVTRARHFRKRFAVITVRAATPAAQGSAEESSDSGSARRPPSWGRQMRRRLEGSPGAGGAGQEAHVSRWSRRVRAQLRPVDRMAVYSADTAQILLPEITQEEARRIAGSIAARPGSNDAARPGSNDAARPEPKEAALLAGVAVYPDAATTAEELVARSREALARASAEGPVQVAAAAKEVVAAAPPGALPPVAGSGMRGVLATAARIAAARIPVILHGETGTGKEVLARFLHDNSPRRERPMVCVNCAAIPAQLVESTLFGHERGAFTGATQQQKGVFEEANGGTVFLDEVGELPQAAQAALLRVLESGSFSRVGSSRAIKVDVRVLAATHRDLDAMVAEGSFREDLYFRLNTETLVIPPLRERADEIEPLALRFLAEASAANGCQVRGIGPEALKLLRRYRWPGNVRELRNAIERAVVVADAEVIRPVDLPARVREAEGNQGPAAAGGAPVNRSGGGAAGRATGRAPAARHAGPPAAPAREHAAAAPDADGDLKSRVTQYESKLIREALEAARWSQAEAAQRLGMPLRTLQYKMKTLGLQQLEGAGERDQPPKSEPGRGERARRR